MNSLSTLVVSIASLVTFAACGVEADRSSEPFEDGAQVIRIAEWDGADDLSSHAVPAELEYAELVDIDAAGQVGGICACDSDACVKTYVLETYGCGICVDAVCDGEFVGGCYGCSNDGAIANRPADVSAAATANDLVQR